MTETLGRFLSNVIEFILSGVLFLTAVVIALTTYFPTGMSRLGDRLAGAVDVVSSDALLFVIGSAFAYAIGTFAENISRLAFEWRLNQVKAARRRANPDIVTYGAMRFAVMASHPSLYLEIESQLKRMRIERVVTLSLAILLPAALTSAVRELTWLRASVVLLLFIALAAMLWQVEERFRRYCRAIERGYTIVTSRS